MYDEASPQCALLCDSFCIVKQEDRDPDCHLGCYQPQRGPVFLMDSAAVREQMDELRRQQINGPSRTKLERLRDHNP